MRNLEQFWEIDQNNAEKKKTEDWIKSFKNYVDKTKFKSDIQMTNPLVEKNLFQNHFIDDKNEDPFMAKESVQIIKMDLNYMSMLTATEVRYIHDLNRMLWEVKDKEQIYDIVESSNLMEILSEDKKNRFFNMNPKLVRVD